jgi:TetR/AcrR family transcriptional repressor of nem operon
MVDRFVDGIVGNVVGGGLGTKQEMIADVLFDEAMAIVTANDGWGSCSALAPEIARSDRRTRAVTSEQVRHDVQLIATLLPGEDKSTARSQAILTFSALVGAMSLARAVSDEALSREILETVGGHLKRFASKQQGIKPG